MKIVFLEPLGLTADAVRQAAQPFVDASHDVVVYPDKNPDASELIRRAADADVVVESNMPLRKEFFDACPKLKMLSIAFTGLDHIDMDECAKRGIVVRNAAGYSTNAVAELAFAMMIGLCRKMTENDAITRAAERSGIMPGIELAGKTIGIIGAGNIGQRVAELAKAFGCHVLMWNRTPKTIDGVTFVDKETLLKEADIVTLHIALNGETRDFITAKELSLMKNTAMLINTARGPVVNENDLADALNAGTIAGAAVDVYSTEPPVAKNHPLLTAKNTLLLPHVGFATREAFEKRLDIVVHNVMQWLGM